MSLRIALAILLLGGLLLGPATAAEDAAPATGAPMPVSLEDCIRMALGDNLDVKIGAYGPGIARQGVREAAGEFDQYLTFRSSGGHAETPTASEILGAAVLDTRRFAVEVATSRRLGTGAAFEFGWRTERQSTNSFFASLNPSWTSGVYLELTQPLLRGGWTSYNRSRIELARAQRDISRDELDGAVQDVITRVEAAYWGLVAAVADVEVKRSSLEVAQEFTVTTRRRIDAQKATRVEETQALAGVESRRVDLIVAENALGNARDALRALILPFRGGEGPGPVPIPTDTPLATEETILPEAEAIAVALERHPAIRAMRRAVKSRDIEVDRAENEALPRLDVVGTARLAAVDGSLGDTWDPLLGGDNFQWELGVVFEIPIGNRSARARLARARLERERERARLARLRNDVVVEVRASRRGVRSGWKSIAAAERATQLAAEQLSNERRRLDAGVATPFAVLQMEQDLTDARSREIRARTLYRVALAAYRRSIGSQVELHAVDLRALEIR